MKRIALLAFAAIVLASCGKTVEVEQWRVLEIPFSSEQDYSQSGADSVIMDVTFTSGSTELTVPAFWDGGNCFLVRFAPTLPGKWKWKTTCAKDKALDGQKGSLRCIGYSGELDIYKHGFVTAEKGIKYMRHADGTPFFYLGDTHWSMYSEEFDEAGPHACDIDTDSHFKHLVKRRAEQGFTVYQSEPINSPFDLTDGKVDQEDIEGFRIADRYYQEIADAGLVHANAEFFFVSSMSREFTDSNLEAMSRYWVARFGAYPVLWTLGQECDNDFYYERGDSWYDWTCNPWVKVGEYIHKYDTYHHPLSAHQETTWNTTITGKGPHEDVSTISGGGVSAFADQDVAERTGHNWWAAQWSPNMTEPQSDDLIEDYLASPYPAINYEGRYCNLWTKNFGSRAQGWISFLSGFMGYGYGAEDIWLYKSTYDIDNTSYDGVDEITPEDKKVFWGESVEFESALQMRHMRNFFESFDWWHLEPVLLGSNCFVPEPETVYSFARTPERMVLYFISKGTTTGSVSKLNPGDKYTMEWYNPRTGEKSSSQILEVSTDGHLALPPKPDDLDWALSITR